MVQIVDPGRRTTHRQQLSAAGLDVVGAEARRQLHILGWDEVHLHDGRFDPDAMLGRAEKIIRASREAGFRRARIVGEMAWALQARPGADRLLEYEARVNEVLTRGRQPAVCAYDITRFSPGVLVGVLRTHPVVVLGGRLLENPFFVPPEEFLRRSSSPPSSMARTTVTAGRVLGHTGELQALRACLRDLTALSALPGLLSGHDAAGIAAGILDVVFSLLRLAVGYVRIETAGDGPPVEEVRPRTGRPAAEVGRALEAPLAADDFLDPAVMPNPVGEGVIRVSRVFLGVGRKEGFLLAGADREDFPTDIERFLLQAAADAASVALERARLYTQSQGVQRQAELESGAKDEFLAMLSHELRNPLGAIAGAARLLEGAARRDAVALRAHAVIDRQVSHLARLVDDLLDVGRLTTGKIVLTRRPVDLGALATNMVAGWRAAGRLGRHHVAHRIEAAWVDGDETRLEQIVSNLLNNALRFTPEGGTVTIRVRTEGTDAVLEVDDSGVGIPADAIGRVFDPFFQGERGPDRAQGGLGIGLTLVRRLVQLHGGSVAASSEGPGCGSVFTVRLPLIAPPPPAEDGGTGPRHAPRRILIIEDHVDSREMLRLALEREGHTVVEAATAYDGLQAARRAAPDIVLVDIGLPEIDGYEVARRLRAALGSAVILVALTGYGAQEDRRRGEEAGFDAHLVKPVDPARLLALITASPGRRP